MPWMGVGVYFPASALRAGVRAACTGFEGFIVFFAALLRAVGFLAVGRLFMSRTVQPVRASVNAPADATARR
jgi:hypothetical protein